MDASTPGTTPKIDGPFFYFSTPGLEIMGPAYRTFAGMMICLFFAVALMILAGLAYVFNTWFSLALVTSVPFVSLFRYAACNSINHHSIDEPSAHILPSFWPPGIMIEACRRVRYLVHIVSKYVIVHYFFSALAIKTNIKLLVLRAREPQVVAQLQQAGRGRKNCPVHCQVERQGDTARLCPPIRRGKFFSQ